MHHVCAAWVLFSLKVYVMDNLDNIYMIYSVTFLFVVLVLIIGVCLYA